MERQARRIQGAVPEIPGMNPADNLIAYIERKLTLIPATPSRLTWDG